MNKSIVSEMQAHIVPLVVRLRDLDVLQRLCWQRGWEFRVGPTRYRCLAVPAEAGRCAHAITIPGCRYEIGLVQEGDHFALAWDDDPEGGLLAVLGSGLRRLWRGYVVEMVRQAAGQRGHAAGIPVETQGTLRVRIAEPHSQRSAHVRMSAEGDTTLWTFGPGAGESFRYLTLALGHAANPPDGEDCP